MKGYRKLTNKEIIKLKEEDIQDLIDLECAELGIKISQRPEEPKKPEVEKDIEAFKVGEMFFKTEKEAQQIYEAIRNVEIFRSDYDYKYGSEWKYLELSNSYGKGLTLNKVGFLSRKKLEILGNDLKKYNVKKDLFDKRLADWEQQEEDRGKAEKVVRDRIDKVWNEENEKQEMMKQYKKYLRLAGDDKEIAKKFLCDAYGSEHVRKLLGDEYYIMTPDPRD